MLKKEIIEIIKTYDMNRDEANEVIHEAIINYGPEELLEFLAGKDFMNNLPKALTMYCFRNGPVENMHAGYPAEIAPENTKPEDISQLSQEDMKILNKYMVDKLGFMLHLLIEGRYIDMAAILEWHLLCSENWDNPDIKKEEAQWRASELKSKKRIRALNEQKGKNI